VVVVNPTAPLEAHHATQLNTTSIYPDQTGPQEHQRTTTPTCMPRMSRYAPEATHSAAKPRTAFGVAAEGDPVWDLMLGQAQASFEHYLNLSASIRASASCIESLPGAI
jgi:hypothetical protein